MLSLWDCSLQVAELGRRVRAQLEQLHHVVRSWRWVNRHLHAAARLCERVQSFLHVLVASVPSDIQSVLASLRKVGHRRSHN